MLSQARLMELFDYEPTSGFFRHKVKRRVGAIAGCADNFGYWKFRIDGKFYKAHRLAWLYVHGEFPQGDLDHINGIKGDNRIENLRLANRSQNNANSVGRNKLKGINWNGHSWVARIKKNRKDIHIGSFRTKTDALKAYTEKARTLYGPFARISALMLFLVVAGCAPTLSSVSPNGARAIGQAAFRPITWSRKDTAPTVRQIKLHNAVGVKLGLWAYPPKRRAK